MNANLEIPFLAHRLAVLKALDEFEFQLKVAKEGFDYERALTELGDKAMGMRNFYRHSVALIVSIKQHKFFRNTLAYRANLVKGCREGRMEDGLSVSFAAMQTAACVLYEILIDAVKKIIGHSSTATRNIGFRKALTEFESGIAILRNVKYFNPEPVRIDMFEHGFKNSTILSEYLKKR